MGAYVRRYWPHVAATRIAGRRWAAFVKITQDVLSLTATQAEAAVFAKSSAESFSVTAASAESSTFFETSASILVLTSSQTGSLGGSGVLGWNALSDATGYKVYWATTSWGYEDAAAVAAGSIAGVATVGAVTSIASWSTFSGIGTGTRYFNIRAYDESGLEGPWITDTELQKVVT